MASLGGRAVASTTDYDVITVPTDTRKEFTVGDGETFENKLIDITADGATFQIDAEGSDWVIRNVGIKGTWDVVSDGHQQAIAAQVDEGATGVIDSFYFADGCPDDTYPGVTGIYVSRTHAGTLEITNVNIQEVPNNAIYASTMGRPDENEHGVPGGEGGVLKIRDSYAAACQAANFRIGTTGSVVDNCVAVGGDRGVWAKFNDTRVVDSDLTGHNQSYCDGDIVCGSYGWEASQEAEVTLDNTVFGHSAPGDQDVNYAGTIHGESADRSPRTSPPDGVPTTPEEAATGASSSNHTFAVQSADGVGWRSYELTVSGEPTRLAADDTDTIVQNDDGTWTVSGDVVGSGTDSYEFSGEILAWRSEFTTEECTVTVDGTEVSLSSLPSGNDSTSEPTTHTFAVEAADGVGWRSYELTVSGEPTRMAADDTDNIVQNDDGTWTVSGAVVGGGTDSYEFSGEILAWRSEFTAEGCTITVDSQEVSLSVLPNGSDSTDSSKSHVVRFELADRVGWRSYELTTSEEPTRKAADDTDKISQNDDGTWTVSGAVVGGGTDSYEFAGSVVAWSTEMAVDEVTITVDGREVTMRELRDV